MSEDTTPIYRNEFVVVHVETVEDGLSGSRGSINSSQLDYGGERPSESNESVAEDNSETEEDEIIHLSLDKEESSARLTGLKAYIRSTFQWFPDTASATEKAICTTMQVLIVSILVCCYGFDMGAFNNRSLVKEEMNETVTAAKNFIWSLRFLELNVLGVLYFRKRHLERMLSKVILTRRYWKKTQKTISKAILAVICCVIFFPLLLKAVQMNLSTRKVASFNVKQISLANSLSLFARLVALPMFVGFIYEVYIIFSHIRFFKEQIQEWPEDKFEEARNRFIDIKKMIRDAERNFQPFLITHLLLLLILLIPSIFSCAERFQTEIYYRQKYSDPMMLTPAAQIPSNTGFTVSNVSSFYNNNEMGLFLKITGPNNTRHQVKTYKLPFEYTDKLTDVKEVIRIGSSALGDFLEMLVLYTLPLVFLAKLHKIMTSLPEVVRDLKFSEQRDLEAGFLFQNRQILNEVLEDLSTGRGIQIMGMNMTGVKTALVTLLLPFLTTAIHLLLLHVDPN
ncbi:unnamed protein product [Porites evermanni]|uniref:Gustatory receptor n=1 Tax=Porites evermanni TaxID=104178 RepID=A0ABN8SSV1_9CNID|nr:unnamed protein product [Porites evermanni]